MEDIHGRLGVPRRGDPWAWSVYIRSTFRSNQRKLINNSHRESFSLELHPKPRRGKPRVGTTAQWWHQEPGLFPSFCLIILRMLSFTFSLSPRDCKMATVLPDLLSTFQTGERDMSEGQKTPWTNSAFFFGNQYPLPKTFFFPEQ